MDDKESRIKFLQDKYRRLYNHPEYARSGGFFRTKRRKQLLDISGKSGRDRSKSDFWYDVRETVKTALIDLELFIDTARDKDLNAVLTKDSLNGIVSALLFPGEQNSTKSRIAYLFVRFGLQYLRDSTKYLTKKQKKEINDAIELSQQLTMLHLSDSERPSFYYSGGRT